MKKVIGLLLNSILHLIFISAIILAFYPFASWYLGGKYLYGIDFYNSVSLLTFLKQNPAFPPLVWFSNWFGGWPYYLGYPILHFYLILPLTKYFSIVDAIQRYALITTIVYGIGLYFLFYTVCKNRLISFILSLGALYSVGYYGALLWGGSMPFYFTQSFLPWILLFLFQFLKNNNYKTFSLVMILSGLSVWAHPQVTLIYVIPAVTIVLLFSKNSNLKFFDFKKIKLLLLYLSVTVFIGIPFLYPNLSQLKTVVAKGHVEEAGSTAPGSPSAISELKAFHKSQPIRMFEDNYQGLFILCGIIGILGIIPVILNFGKKKNNFLLPAIILAGYYFIYVWLYAFGISIFHGGWYRLFWSVPIWAGLLTASFWFEFDQLVKRIIPNQIISFGLVFFVSVVIVGATLTVSKQKSVMPAPNSGLSYEIIWNQINVITDNLSAQINSILTPFNPEMFIKAVTHNSRANFASGFPGMLMSKSNNKENMRSALPSFIDLSRNNTRLYCADQTFNIWWNSFFTIPLARGYLDPPIAVSKRGYHFWLDGALNVDPKKPDKPLLPSVYGYPEDIAIQNARYLIDWNAIEYLQGGGSSPYPGVINNLIDNPDFIEKKETIKIDNFPDLKSLAIPDENFTSSTLQYYQIKKELVSPVISATNVPLIGIFGSEQGYETIIRSLAALDLNSKWIVPVKLNKYLDQYSLSELSQFDAIILYDYDYSNYGKAFNPLIKYAEKGGKLFIDSGVETKESEAGKELPLVFPVDKLKRTGLGNQWLLKVNEKDLYKDIDLGNFSPTMFDRDQWKFAVPEGDIRDEVNVLATNYGHPVLTQMKIGEGTVIWSGMNLFYHISRYNNTSEANFFKNILARLLTLEKKEPQSVNFDWSNSRVLTIKNVGGKGLLVKEQLFPGWQARIKDKEKLTIWPAGPAIPGYMYVKLPNNTRNADVVFTYNGSLVTWLFWLIAIITMLIIADYIIIKGSVIKLFSNTYKKTLGKIIKKWWDKEDEAV